MKYLGSCEVCGRAFRSYRSFSQHLRHSVDEAHLSLKSEYLSWKGRVRSLRCRKCGGVWQTLEGGHRKICPRCSDLKKSLSKRAYEALRFERVEDVRPDQSSKAKWIPSSDPTNFLPISRIPWSKCRTTKPLRRLFLTWGTLLFDTQRVRFTQVRLFNISPLCGRIFPPRSCFVCGARIMWRFGCELEAN